jgi:hypothetical protein
MMKSYLSNRNQFVEASGFSSNLDNITIGVPQVSILGPLLFLIYMNDLARATNYFHMIKLNYKVPICGRSRDAKYIG